MNSMCGNHFGKKQNTHQFQQKKQPAPFFLIPMHYLENNLTKRFVGTNCVIVIARNRSCIHTSSSTTHSNRKIKSKMEWFQNQLHWNKQLNLFDVQSNHHGLDANQNPWVQQWNLRIYMRVCGHVCFICWTCSSTCHISLMAKTWLWKSDRATCRMPWIVTWTHWKNVNVLEGLMSGGGSEQLFNTWFKRISHCVMRVTGCQSSSWFT